MSAVMLASIHGNLFDGHLRPPHSVPRSPNGGEGTRPDLLPDHVVADDAAESREAAAFAGQIKKRKNKRVSRAGGVGWREEVEERLLHKSKSKRKPASWTEELNLDHLARLGPQWWVIRVARVNGHETADRLARRLSRSYPSLEFKVYFPAVRLKRKSKIGSESVKLKPLFPGCVFLNCILNKEIHDFIREVDGVGGFVGSKVGNTFCTAITALYAVLQLSKRGPLVPFNVEFLRTVEKENYLVVTTGFLEDEITKEIIFLLPDILLTCYFLYCFFSSKRQINKPKPMNKISPPVGLEGPKSLSPGATVRILSGPLSEFTGCIKELNQQTGKVSVNLQLFGTATTVDLEVDQLVLEAS
ncbi:hypothetical protein ZIOFF_007118 [Zingiber officinale]|uniref:NusG-like N-terminal domain-containing protein n=1 Tax=Zingiber officinale TaxID=94328 RepID=A0A8J5HWM5_ZINOF|nr:hypothetical protein ZIOFF_007118 [Zingiber officinale]